MRNVLVGLPLLLATLIGQAGTAAASGWWQPTPGLEWQVQFSGSIDTTAGADVFDLDGFDTPRSLVASLHDDGRRTVCYVNAGAWESWRSDAGRYPASVKGRQLDGWPGERWLDIRRLDVLKSIIRERVAMCAAKGFDAVEFDNVDGYANRTGFPLEAADQLRYNRWLARAAHDAGLGVGLKNTLGLAQELEPHFDFALLEQCFQFQECALADPFVRAGKPVIDIEYALPRSEFCPAAEGLGISAMKKRLRLDAWRRACP